MKTFSYSQQNLLDVLRITPLQLNAAFVSEQYREVQVETQSSPDTQILTAPDLSQALAQDIQLALPDSVNWQIHSLSDNVELNDKQLLTPALEKLQQAQSKKTLWRLLSALHED
ncbi:hypothetical protein [Rheinheimera aquimaris]|jgi:hypothetical protein|uniref:hypothetical protein n=1 Tax=Rheinheimera aquimaris TaxID=412437 RepID=UPI001066B147|nr:hypothetical protein [Rheinheimera aquimaris]MCD1600435.1 hypothetical protein [Rheinheimera aquimaris]